MSSNGNELVTCGWSDENTPSVIVWSLDGVPLATFVPKEAFDEQSAMLAEAGLPLYQPPLSMVGWSPDGKVIAMAQEYKTHLWDYRSNRGTCVYESSMHSAPDEGGVLIAGSAQWSSDGRLLVCTYQRAFLEVWDTATHQVIATYRFPLNHLYECTWVPHSYRLFLVWDNHVSLWDVTTETIIADSVPPAPMEEFPHLFCTAVSPDGKAIAAASQTDRNDEHQAELWGWEHHLLLEE